MATSARSRSTSAKNKAKASDRPFEPDVLRRARKAADPYQVVVWPEDGEWYGRGVELPGVMDDGRTPDECVRKVRAALVGAVAYLIESGHPVPAPANGPRRTEQVNVRLTPAEKLALEDAARRLGFDGVSDYVRATAVERAGSIGPKA